MEDVDRLAETGWNGDLGRAAGLLGGGRRGGAAGSGRAGPGRARGGEGGTCKCPGNVGNVSEKLQTLWSKERARIGFVVKKRGGLGKDARGVWERNVFYGKKLIFVGKENCIIWSTC